MRAGLRDSSGCMNILRQFSLEGKVAVVTGSSRGIGRAIAAGFAGAGAAVTVNGRDPETAESTASTIVAAGGRSHAVIADVSNATDVDRLIDTTIAKFGRLDIRVKDGGVGGGWGGGGGGGGGGVGGVMKINLKGVF